MKVTFTEDFLEKVKHGNDIVEVAEEYFTLTKSGDLYKAHCKHKGGDKTPSLVFFPKTQSFYCFGCHAGRRDGSTEGSDVISFIQWMENISWQDAVIFLAKRADVPIPQAQLSADDKRKLALYDSAMIENRAYWSKLYKNKEAKEWFTSRGIEDTDIAKWRLGITDGNIPVYAIIDDYGRTAGFSFRRDNEQGKYVNSKTSEIFKKGSILYGLNYVKKLIRQEGFVVLVEGFNDVIFLQKYGVPAVGLMGTAVTTDQMSLIRKYTNNVVLFLDGDLPGIESTVDNIKLLKAEGFEVEAINIKGFDPDDLAKKHIDNTFQFIKDNKMLAFQFLINNVLDKYFDSMIRLKKETVRNLNDILNYIEDEQEKKIYHDQLMKVISLEEEP